MEWLTGFLLLLGATLVLLAAIGVLRMPGFYTDAGGNEGRHARPGLLAAGRCHTAGRLPSLVRAIRIGAFVMLTSPVSTHVIARVRISRVSPCGRARWWTSGERTMGLGRTIRLPEGGDRYHWRRQ